MNDPEITETVVIVNPASGSGDHVDPIAARSLRKGCGVRVSDGPGTAVTITKDEIDAGADRIVAAGGDGTLNEVIRGVKAADSFEHVTIGVIPAGTGNNFAKNIGLVGIDTAFAALESGSARWLDLGIANDFPFINSCVGGLTADASAETNSAAKARFGALAYVVTTMRLVPNYDGIELVIDSWRGPRNRESVWSGTAICLFVGNGRRFPSSGPRQTDIEDGYFDVAIVEQASSLQLIADSIKEGLLENDTKLPINRFLASSIQVGVREDHAVGFSLDGEIIEVEALRLHVEPGHVRMKVGPDYEHPL